jgi:hypothetical protein
VLSDGNFTRLDPPGSIAGSARGINNHGQIVGHAFVGPSFSVHGFVATPILEPSTAVLGVVGTSLMALYCRRGRVRW